MDDQLDNDLRDRIREVFDNYEDTTADEGWLLLREKFPVQEKQRRPVFLWWASAAAVLLLFMGIGMWLTTKPDQSNANTTYAVAPVKPKHPATGSNAAQVNAQATSPAVISSPVTTPPVNGAASAVQQNSMAGNKQKPQTPAINQAGNAKTNTTNPVNGITQVVQPNTIAANTQQGTKPAPDPATGLQPQVAPVQIIAANTNTANTFAAAARQQKQQPANSNPLINASAFKKTDSAFKALPNKAEPQQYATNTPAAGQIQAVIATPLNTAITQGSTATPMVKVKPKINSMEALLASDVPTQKVDKGIQEKRVRFSVYAATFFNYAKGSQNQVNAGAGVTSDIKLSKNLKLSTGLALAQNTLNYNKSQPTNAREAVSFSPSLTVAYNNQADFNKVSAAPTFKNYNANLIGLDIPVNLKYEFNPQKNDAYVSAGLSSGTFVNEAYTASYSYPGLAIAAGVQQQPADETTHKSFNSFYFAKTLNVAFGVGYPLGKSNRIVIEPFLKYPLDGLGSQQIKFGAGGLNLKLNFTTNKK